MDGIVEGHGALQVGGSRRFGGFGVSVVGGVRHPCGLALTWVREKAEIEIFV